MLWSSWDWDSLSYVFTLIMLSICIVGIIFNVLALIVYTRPAFRKKSINILLSAMSSSDLCVCVIAIPVFCGKVLNIPTSVSNMIMVYAYPICVMFQAMSVGFLVAITIDRYLAVCYPFMVTTYCTSSRALVTVAVIVFISVAYNFIRFWEYEIVYEANSTDVKFLLRADPTFMLWYQNVATLVTQFIIPLIVLCVLNLQVARTIINAAETRKELVAKERREHSTAKMMIFVVIVFLICYIFSFILNVTEIMFPSMFSDENGIGYALNDINNTLVIVNSSSAFIFYVTYSTRFRNQLCTLYGIRFFTARLKFMQSTKTRSISLRKNTYCMENSTSYCSIRTDYNSKSQKTSRVLSGSQTATRKSTLDTQLHSTTLQMNSNTLDKPLL